MKTIAQFTYIPLYTEHPTEKVQDLLGIVAQHDVEVDVNYLSTTVKGDTEDVFELISEIYDELTAEKEGFRFQVVQLSQYVMKIVNLLNILTINDYNIICKYQKNR